MPVLQKTEIPIQRAAALLIPEALSVGGIAEKDAAFTGKTELLKRQDTEIHFSLKTRLTHMAGGEIHRLRIQIGPGNPLNPGGVSFRPDPRPESFTLLAGKE